MQAHAHEEAGFPVVILVSLVTKKLSQAHLDRIFLCYKQK